MEQAKTKIQVNALPAEGFIRLKQIIGDAKQNLPPIVPVGRTTWLTGVARGIYPQPVKLSERTVAWRVVDIRALIQNIELT